MMIHGSYQPFAHPRSDDATMRRDARDSGLFPKAAKNHQALLEEQLSKITKGQEVGAVRARRIAEDARINNQIENERLQSVLRTQRMPGLRGQASRMRNAQTMADQVNVGFE